MSELFSFGILCNNLNTLVVAASLAYTVSSVILAALGALYDVGGVFKLPNTGASFHFSRMRNLSLWYCHCDFLLRESATRILIYLYYFFSFLRAVSAKATCADRFPFYRTSKHPRSDFCRILNTNPSNLPCREIL